jgi:phenylacetate-CoA ligase
MTEAGRELIENKFGIRVFSRYNAVESFRIGFSCERQHGFHLREDLCCLRIVDTRGNQVKDGEPGEVVLTNLVNRGTVLINYRIGDLGAITHEPCPCGRTLPMLARLEGRSEDIIYLADGRMVHPRTVWSVFKERNDVLRYQLIQHQPDKFELRIVPAGSQARDAVVNSILEDLEKLLGPVEITTSCLEELPMGGRKFRPVISHCGPTLTA